MVTRTQTRKKVTTETTESPPEEQEETPPKTKTEAHDKAVAEIDNLLDEIDSVLEENAEEFVRSYVQKGGE